MTESYTIKLEDNFSAPLAGLETKMNGFESKVKSTNDGLKSSFGSLGGTIAGAFAGGVVISAVQNLIGSLKGLSIGSVMVARDFNNMKEAIQFASGQQATQNIKFLDETIDRLGLDIESTYKGFKTFEGALMGTSLEGDKGREIFTAVSEAATVMKLSAEQTEGSFLALGQMISKGTVSAEELRGQLGERLPGAFQIFARSLGVTTSQLGDMLKKGEVIAEDALPKFAAELKKTFSPGVAKSQESFNSNMNRFSDFVFRAKVALGESLMPVINSFVSIIPKLDFKPLIDEFKMMISPLIIVVDLIGDLLNMFGLDWADVFQAAIKGVALSFHILLTPLRLVVGVFKLLINGARAAGQATSAIFEAVQKGITGDFDGAIAAAGKISGIGSEFAASAASVFKNERDGWANIFASKTEKESKGNEASNTGAGLNSSSGGGLSKMSSGISGTSSSIGGTSSSTKNIVINITNLIKEIQFSKTENWKESEAQLTDRVRRLLLTVVNDVNIVAQ
jgi:tape measure domain-containing protein